MSDEPARHVPTTPFGQSLAKLGLLTKAQRVEETGRKSAQRDGNCDKWWTYVPWESGLRTSRGHAQHLAREQVKWFGCVRELLGESFGVLTLSLPLSLDPKRGTERLTILTLRDTLKRLIPNCFYKIGTSGDYIALKIISVDPLTGDLMSTLESFLPRNVRSEWSNLPAAKFDSCLRRVLAPDLPKHDLDRARLEYVLTPIRQVSLFGSVYTLTGKYKKDIYLLACKSLKTKDRPRNPKTDMPALCYVPPRRESTTFDQIDPHEWHPYLDFLEIDATTPQEHAEMLAAVNSTRTT